jgi:hypothetical protein
MFSQLFKTIAGASGYLALITGFALLQALPINVYTHVPFLLVFIDALFYTLIYALLALLMWNTLKYGKFEALPIIQELLIYTALVLLSLLVIYGAAYGFYTFILPRFSATLLLFLPLRLLLSLLVLLLIIQHLRFKLCLNSDKDLPQGEDITDKAIADEKPTSAEVLERIAVKSNQKIHVILVSEIIFLQAYGDYVQIFTPGGKYLKEQTMKYFEEHLPSALFVRVHRSCIVNVQAIARIELYDKQSQQLTLKNGNQIKVSQAGYKSLRKTLNL